jgi:hypothetical protein
MTTRAAPIIAELHAANAHRIADFTGPDESEFQFWTAAGPALLVQLYPDGGFEFIEIEGINVRTVAGCAAPHARV